MTILTWVLSWLSGGVVDKVLATLNKRVDAQTDAERLRTEITIEAIRAEVSAQAEARAIIVAEQGYWWAALPRPLFAGIFIIYVGKIVVWDKVLALGTTDPLPPYLIDMMGVVVAAYFGGRTIEKVASIVTSRKK